MEYPRHYRVVVRMLDEIGDEDRCPQIADEVERLMVMEEDEEFDEKVLNQRVRENKQREQEELEDRLDRSRFGIPDEESLKQTIKDGTDFYGDGTCDWLPVNNYSYKEIDELLSERLHNYKIMDLKLVEDKSDEIVNHPDLTKVQKKDLLYNLNNLNHHIYTLIDILFPKITIEVTPSCILGIDHLLKLEHQNPNYRVSSPDEYSKWIEEWRDSEQVSGIEQPRWLVSFINLKSQTRSSAIKEVQDLLKDYRRRKDVPTGENVSELLQNQNNEITEMMNIVLLQISNHFENQSRYSSQTEEEIIQYYLESYPDPEARGKLPI
tara:strand:- start:685 stop:1650 length:966 start_codon:yes stop_codon:yes gene_type:complete